MYLNNSFIVAIKETSDLICDQLSLLQFHFYQGKCYLQFAAAAVEIFVYYTHLYSASVWGDCHDPQVCFITVINKSFTFCFLWCSTNWVRESVCELKFVILQHLNQEWIFRTSKLELFTKTSLYNFDPQKPHFFIVKKCKRKAQGMPQSQTVALPRHQEEEETDKTKQAQTEQTYEKH